jgi:DNA polymerase III sliding clamp (beta) subunit (PCNA family)
MSTIEQTRAVEGAGVSYALEVEGDSLRELLEGAITHAHKDKDLPALNAVMLEGEGGYLTARATDRYRLIVGKIEVIEGEISPSLISLSDIKRIVALSKDYKLSGRVSLNRIGDLLTVSVNGNSITLTIVEANYPPSFDDLLNKGEVTAIEVIAFNPAYFADYAKIVGKGVQVSVTFKGDRMPITIGLVGDKVEWKALLMPMRVSK